MSSWKDTGALATQSGGTGFITHPAGSLLYGTSDAGQNGLAHLLTGSAGQLLVAGPAWSDLSWVDIAFNAANFTADAGSWTLDVSGDQVALYYWRPSPKWLGLWWTIGSSTISSSLATYLKIALPLGLTIARRFDNDCILINAGSTHGQAVGVATEGFLRIYNAANTTLTAGTDNVTTAGAVLLPTN